MKSGSAGAQRRPRALLFAAVLTLLGGAAGAGAGEIWARVAKPRPPVQIVRANGLHNIGNTPVWEPSTDRENRECVEAHPERTRILFFGSSITYAFNMPREQAFTTLLEDRLNALRPNPGFCVLNFSQVSFNSQQKLAVASIEVPRYRPAVVMWEGWNEFGNFVLLGDAAYDLRKFVLRADGFPGIRGVPDFLNRWLFLYSRLYSYLTLSVGQRDDSLDELGPARDRLERLAALTSAAGSRLGVYVCPFLNRPFSEPTKLPNGPMDEFVRAHHVPRWFLRRELIDQDYLALRMDDCCHFNPQGQQVLAPIFERMVLAILDGKPAPSWTD
jgi:hypothetical protein